MFRNPAKEGCVTKVTNVTKDCVQPNFIDLKLKKVLKIKPTMFQLSANNKKTLRETEDVLPDEEGYFNFEDGGVYEVVMDHDVKIGEGQCGWLHTRSNLQRSGLTIVSGIFDQGFEGALAGRLTVVGGPARIEKGARVAQFVLADAEGLYDYDGDFGKGKAFDKKYE